MTDSIPFGINLPCYFILEVKYADWRGETDFIPQNVIHIMRHYKLWCDILSEAKHHKLWCDIVSEFLLTWFVCLLRSVMNQIILYGLDHVI